MLGQRRFPRKKNARSSLRARSRFWLIYLSLELTTHQSEQSHYSGAEHGHRRWFGDGTHNRGIAARDARRASKKSHACIDGQLNRYASYSLAVPGYGSG
jgi:hypothetical protein